MRINVVVLTVILSACGNSSSTTSSSTGSLATASTGSAGTSSGTGGTTGGSTGGGTTSGCLSTLTDGGLPATPTWCNYAQAFVGEYCVRCHEAGGAGLPYDFTTYSGMYDAGSLARCGVCVTQDPSWGCASFPPAEQFPIAAPYPSDDERTEMALWFTSGAPQN